MEKPKHKPKTSDYDFSFVAPVPLGVCVERATNRLIYERNLPFNIKWRFFNQRKYVVQANSEEWYFELFFTAAVAFHIIGYLKYRDASTTFVYGAIETSPTLPQYVSVGLFGVFIIFGLITREIFIIIWGIFMIFVMTTRIKPSITRTRENLLNLMDEIFNRINLA